MAKDLERERKELYDKITEAREYVEGLSEFLDNTVYGKQQRNADLYDGMCKVERLMVSDCRLSAFNLLNVLRMYGMVIGNK